MKKAIMLTLIGIILACTTAFAFQNEPEGFRDLKWGDPPMEGMKFDMESNILRVYVLPGDKMQLGSVELSKLVYAFWEGQFIMAGLYFESEENFELMKTLCEQKFGEGREQLSGIFSWDGAIATVVLNYEALEEQGYLGIGSTPLSLAVEQEEKEREAEKAEGDW